MKFSYSIEKLAACPRNLLTTGFYEVDTYFKNMPLKGSIITIGGRPAMGKTSFALSLSNHLIGKEYKVLYVTLDFPKERIEKRFIENKLKLHLKNNNIPPSFNDAIEFFNKTELYIYSHHGLEVEKLEEVISEIKPDIVFIDYVQLLKMPKAPNLTEATNLAIYEIKRIAQEYNLCVFLLSQLSRALESRCEKRPLLSDLRNGSVLEELSDVVMMVYRNDYYNLEDKDNTAEIIFIKNNYGYVNSCRLEFKNGFFNNLKIMDVF